jgi:uncharacterized damage-inducible protein DinB
MLEAWLDFHRITLERKCSGLSPEQLRQRAVPPSSLSLLGLVRHMAEVERNWFKRRFAALDAPPLYYGDHDADGDFHPLASETLGEALTALRAEIDFARQVTAGKPADTLAAGVPATQRIPGWQPNLRWILVHMIEEYARHCGHADLLRQRIDGAVGD